MLRDLLRGLGHGLAGARLVATRPRLWRSVLLPFVLSLAAWIALFAGALALRPHLVPASHVLGALVSIAMVIGVPILAAFAFLPLASLIAGPFNDEIARAVEALVTGREPEPEPFSLRRVLADLGRTVAHEARSLLRWLLLFGAILVATLVLPGIGSLVGLIGGGYVAARFAAWDALDATLSRWGWSYDDKLRFLRARRGRCLGLGGLIAVLLLIPFVNALAMPVGAAGGALLCVEAAPDRRPVSPRT